MTLILAFYSKNDDGSSAAFKGLKARRYFRSAVVRRSEDGVVSLVEGRAAKLLGAFAALSLVLCLGLVLHLSTASILLLGAAGFLAGSWSARCLGLGIPGNLITRYRGWVLDGEALLIVRVAGRRDTRQVLDVLRSGDGNPAIFLDWQLSLPTGAPAALERSAPSRLNSPRAGAAIGGNAPGRIAFRESARFAPPSESQWTGSATGA
jgi:hypothetical protein